MKIAKRGTLAEIGPTAWVEFADDIGMPARFVQRRVVELAEAVRGRSPDLPNDERLGGLDGAALTTYAAMIASRAEDVARSVVPR